LDTKKKGALLLDLACLEHLNVIVAIKEQQKDLTHMLCFQIPCYESYKKIKFLCFHIKIYVPFWDEFKKT
jgi:hypothetical protein